MARSARALAGGVVVRAVSGHDKVAAALRVVRGDDLGAVARELGIPPDDLADWRDIFLVHGATGLEVDFHPRLPASNAFRVLLSDALRPLADPVEIQGEAARLLGIHLGASRVHYGAVVDGGEYGLVKAEYCHGVPGSLGRHRFDDFGPLAMAEFRAGRILVVENVDEDPRLTAAERTATKGLMIGAYVLMPLIKRRHPVAVFVVHMTEPHAWDAEELELIVETAERTWDAVERAHAEAALKASEERYRTLFESISDGFCIMEAILDEQGACADFRFVEINPAFERQTGLANAKGRTARELVPGLEEHWIEICGDIAARRERSQFVEHVASLDRWFEVDAYPIGEPRERRMAALFKDVTASRRAEEALQEAGKRKDAFLATLAHELRNPLAPIMNAVEILKREGRGPAAQQVLPLVERQLGHLVRLIDDLLDMSRITHGKLHLRRQQVTLAEIIQSAVESSTPYVQMSENTLTVSLPSEPVCLHADPVRLAQVFLNLLKNAAKFSMPGGQIRLSAERDDGQIVVTVADTGVGISASCMPHIFDKFSQGEMVASGFAEGGLGIGLSLARELVEMHDGDIEARSEGSGRGSQFIVRLPVLDVPARPAAEPAPKPDACRAPVSHRRVLVVDDNVDAATSLAMFLRLCGHDVEVAGDGVEAVEAAERFRPEVIFLDIGMPRLDGYGACRRIRAEPWGKEMVIVALTGWAQEEDRRKTREAGFDAHLVKPVGGAHLQELLGELQPEPLGLDPGQR
jgi:PAS domain S-box-containing protein